MPDRGGVGLLSQPETYKAGYVNADLREQHKDPPS